MTEALVLSSIHADTDWQVVACSQGLLLLLTCLPPLYKFALESDCDKALRCHSQIQVSECVCRSRNKYGMAQL